MNESILLLVSFLDVRFGMQETQLSTSSPMVMGHPLGEPLPQCPEIRERE